MGPAQIDVRPATQQDVPELADLLARAFQDDPFTRWIMPAEAERRRRAFGAYEMMLRRIYLPKGAVFTDGGRRSCAVWSPPGAWRLSTRQQIRLFPPLARAYGLRNLGRLMRSFEVSDKVHPDDRPHWYLALLATDPSQQGLGLASAVLGPVLDRCDTEATPAYLETSNPANLEFYRRHGFDVAVEFEVSDDGPTSWGMWREPRS